MYTRSQVIIKISRIGNKDLVHCWTIGLILLLPEKCLATIILQTFYAAIGIMTKKWKITDFYSQWAIKHVLQQADLLKMW